MKKLYGTKVDPVNTRFISNNFLYILMNLIGYTFHFLIELSTPEGTGETRGSFYLQN